MSGGGSVARGRASFRDRYGPADLGVFTPEERARFQVPEELPGRIPAELRWELLYRLEPELYDRLVAAERLHPGILEWLPSHPRRCIEIGAGAGRLTLQLATRCDHLLAVEPAAPLRSILAGRVAAAGLAQVTVTAGFVDAIPAESGSAELVIACSAVTPSPHHGGDRGLAEMERVCARGGRVVIVWPTDPQWFAAHGYRHRRFGPPLPMEFRSPEEADELTTIFYPHAAEAVRLARASIVPCKLLHKESPCDVAWKDLPS